MDYKTKTFALPRNCGIVLPRSYLIVAGLWIPLRTPNSSERHLQTQSRADNYETDWNPNEISLRSDAIPGLSQGFPGS